MQSPVHFCLQDLATITAGSMEYEGEQDLLQHTVTEWQIRAVSHPRIKVEAVLRFQRHYINHLFTTLLPSSCLLFLSYCTLFFKKEHYKTSVPVIIVLLLGGHFEHHQITC